MINRNTMEYQLAEKIVHLEDALSTANKLLNEDGKLGVLPSRSVRFREGNTFHKRVRQLLIIKKCKNYLPF